MSDFRKALRDPAGTYKYPRKVLDDKTLTHDEKVKVLRQWKYDALELQVAEEENMAPGDKPTMLRRVLRALAKLGASVDPEQTPPTKHGGGVDTQ